MKVKTGIANPIEINIITFFFIDIDVDQFPIFLKMLNL